MSTEIQQRHRDLAEKILGLYLNDPEACGVHYASQLIAEFEQDCESVCDAKIDKLETLILQERAGYKVAELDSRRLDWLDGQSSSLIWDDNGFWYLSGARAWPSGSNPRSAIDAAMQKQK